jgi:hypothetical protein
MSEYHKCAKSSPTCAGLNKGISGYHACAKSKKCGVKNKEKPKKLEERVIEKKSKELKKYKDMYLNERKQKHNEYRILLLDALDTSNRTLTESSKLMLKVSNKFNKDIRELGKKYNVNLTLEETRDIYKKEYEKEKKDRDKKEKKRQKLTQKAEDAVFKVIRRKKELGKRRDGTKKIKLII